MIRGHRAEHMLQGASCYRWIEPGDRSHAKPVSNGLNQTGTAHAGPD